MKQIKKRIRSGICKHCTKAFTTAYPRTSAPVFCNLACFDAYRTLHGVPSRRGVTLCHPERKYFARGMCKLCYDMDRYRRCNLRAKARKIELKKHFGMEPEDYAAMLESQEFRCRICTKHQSEQKKAMGVDHDHKTNAIRDLLCNSCNTLVGHVEALGYEHLNRIREYLERHAQ